MPPRPRGNAAAGARAATQQEAQGGDEAGPSDRIPEYVTFALIQAIMADGYKQEQEVKYMVRRLLDKNNDDSYMPVYSKIQKDLQWLEINIERIKLPVNNEWYLCSVNKDPDEAAKQMGGCYTIEQMDYFRAVVDKIGSQPPSGDALIAEVNSMMLKNVEPMPATATAPAPAAGTAGGSAAGGAATPAQGTQAAAAGRAQKAKMSVVEREETLRKLTSQGWLFMSRDGYYTLGPRTLLELKELVMSTLPPEAAERLSSNYM